MLAAEALSAEAPHFCKLEDYSICEQIGSGRIGLISEGTMRSSTIAVTAMEHNYMRSYGLLLEQ